MKLKTAPETAEAVTLEEVRAAVRWAPLPPPASSTTAPPFLEVPRGRVATPGDVVNLAGGHGTLGELSPAPRACAATSLRTRGGRRVPPRPRRRRAACAPRAATSPGSPACRSTRAAPSALLSVPRAARRRWSTSTGATASRAPTRREGLVDARRAAGAARRPAGRGAAGRRGRLAGLRRRRRGADHGVAPSGARAGCRRGTEGAPARAVGRRRRLLRGLPRGPGGGAAHAGRPRLAGVNGMAPPPSDEHVATTFPVLFVNGADDATIDHAAAARSLAALDRPDASAVAVAGAGHGLADDEGRLLDWGLRRLGLGCMCAASPYPVKGTRTGLSAFGEILPRDSPKSQHTSWVVVGIVVTRRRSLPRRCPSCEVPKMA